jgi:TM2 domain-containing membrane protein YozV
MGTEYPEFDEGKGAGGKPQPANLQFNCPHCQAVLAISPDNAGDTVACPHCQGKFQVPVPQAYVNPAAGGAYSNAQYPPEYQAFVSKKIAAGICGILLGALGVHKFILGLNSGGAIMVSIYFGCLVTGMCLFVPILGCIAVSIIGVIEGIMYLTKTDEEFFQSYYIEKRQWF